ncbi:hypothetical protein [Streptomyces goshikiensis]|uniref:hypothetical protein n=1 Tax=Streptomyces goshikiensis TaxID=1942 RepID=UPI00365837EF
MELARAMQAIGQASVHGPYEVEVRVRVIPTRVAVRQRQLRAEAVEHLRQQTEASPWREQGPRSGRTGR